MARPKPFDLYGESTAQTVREIDEMFAILFQDTSVGHKLLSAIHTDTVEADVARGSLITGQTHLATTTIKWKRLVIGAAARVLRSDGTDASWAQVVLTSDVTGVLPVGNGGTGTGTAFTQGSVVFAGPSGVYAQDNANFFWNDTTNRLSIGAASASGTVHIQGAAGDTHTLFIRTGAAGNNLISGRNSSATTIFQVLDSVEMGLFAFKTLRAQLKLN